MSQSGSLQVNVNQTPTTTDAQAVEESSNRNKKPVRSYIACRKCHAQKVKCSGETPCRNCKVSKNPVECIYPVRDKKIAVSERYLRTLEGQSRALKRGASETSPDNVPNVLHEQSLVPPEAPRPRKRTAAAASLTPDANIPSPLEQSSVVEEERESLPDEASIQPTYVGEAACTTFGGRLRQFLVGEDSPVVPRRPKYYKHSRMLRASRTDCQLPNRSDAQLLVRVVLRFIGADYHLLRRRSFLERLDETYRLDVLNDPIWLCRLFTVFALGEIYTVRSSKPKGVPGISFFLKALEYFQDLYEEPTVEYIETLVLLAFYSTTLNRRNTAYTYIGLALRLSIMLGLHRKIPANSSLSPPEREHRIRVWWTVYTLDRLMSSKVGLPTMIQDTEIDAQIPSMNGLTQHDMEDFYNPAHLVAQITLSRITGNVLGNIYHIPQADRTNTFVRGVQTTLTSLRNFHEGLPPILRLDPNNSPMYLNRSVASLHLHFNQCVILTTRPILFYLFRQKFAQTSNSSEDSRPSSHMTTVLADACVQTARKSNRILSQLWVDGCLAMYGFYDALSIFSSTLVLMISTAMEDPDAYATNDDDGIGVAWSLLRSMRDDGNVPASDYYEQLAQIEEDLKDACARRRKRPEILPAPPPPPNTNNAHGLHLLLAASGTDNHQVPQIPSDNTQHGSMAIPPAFHGESTSMGDPLNDPFLSGFLSQPQAAWDPTAFEPMFTGNNDQHLWDFNWEGGVVD
ncbi:putative transcriptional regulatory protein [Lachnellula subtilissima]|uniref:Putative transcriptional regulatory protein n=1 Tax=Lachnellula subtilissima TaxID=602034 RepID=A0A8H8UAI2_9HELO|nr:putative transcriptional regulatory protein [Lachnellula subtilissima]